MLSPIPAFFLAAFLPLIPRWCPGHLIWSIPMVTHSNSAILACTSDRRERNTADSAMYAYCSSTIVRHEESHMPSAIDRCLHRAPSQLDSLLRCMFPLPDCPWVGSCVGLRNYRYFLLFLLSVLSLSCLVFGSSVYVLVARGDSAADSGASWTQRIGDTIQDRPTEFALGIFLAGVILSVFILLTYHLNLLRKGETTNESLRGTYRRHINYYNHGFVNNLRRVFTDIPPSQLDFLSEEVLPGSIPGIARSRDEMRRRRGFDALSPRFNTRTMQVDERKQPDEEIGSGTNQGAGSGPNTPYTAYQHADHDETNNLLEPLSPNGNQHSSY